MNRYVIFYFYLYTPILYIYKIGGPFLYYMADGAGYIDCMAPGPDNFRVSEHQRIDAMHKCASIFNIKSMGSCVN